MTEFPAEMELLRAASRHHFTGNYALAERAPLFLHVNWHHVLWLGRQQRILPVLADRLKNPALAQHCPVEIVAQLSAFREVSQLRALARAREACQLQDLFNRHAIPALATDAWMAAQACGARAELVESETSLRYVVPAADLERTTAILVEAGHPRENDPEKLILAGCSPVRLNSGLGKHAAAPRFWRNSATFTFGGRTHRRPAFGHWLLFRTARRRHCEISLGDAREIVALSRSIAAVEWPSVLAEAAHFGLANEVWRFVTESYTILLLPPPEGLPAYDETIERPVGATHANLLAPSRPSVAAPFLPTPPRVVERMLALAEAGPRDVVCDLGCGDGRIAIKAAKDFGARGFGVDRDPVRIADATALAAAQGVSDRVTFHSGDLFEAELTDATIVTCYLLPQLQPRLLQKLRREARSGTRIVSHEFIFPGWPPEKTEIVRVGPLKVSQIYLWRMP